MTIPIYQQWRFVACMLSRHVSRFWWAYGLSAAFFTWSAAHYRIAVNLSDSLPDAVYIVELGTRPTQVGDYVAFEWQRDQFYRRDWIFIKRVGGVAGQTVDVRDRSVFIDGRRIGYAKRKSRLGVPLAPIRAGVIPAGHLYVEAPHPDSLDSRYEVTGLIQTARIVGRAYAIF